MEKAVPLGATGCLNNTLTGCAGVCLNIMRPQAQRRRMTGCKLGRVLAARAVHTSSVVGLGGGSVRAAPGSGMMFRPCRPAQFLLNSAPSNKIMAE
jgi:hypothetical protein